MRARSWSALAIAPESGMIAAQRSNDRWLGQAGKFALVARTQRLIHASRFEIQDFATLRRGACGTEPIRLGHGQGTGSE